MDGLIFSSRPFNIDTLQEGLMIVLLYCRLEEIWQRDSKSMAVKH